MGIDIYSLPFGRCAGGPGFLKGRKWKLTKEITAQQKVVRAACMWLNVSRQATARVGTAIFAVTVQTILKMLFVLNVAAKRHLAKGLEFN